VSEVHKNKVILDDGTVIKCGLIVWSTGVGAHEVTKSFPFTTKDGKIITNDRLQVKSFPDIYAIGDCATIENTPLPTTAQVAQQKGRYLATSLNDKSDKPFKFHFLGMMAYIGRYKGEREKEVQFVCSSLFLSRCRSSSGKSSRCWFLDLVEKRILNKTWID